MHPKLKGLRVPEVTLWDGKGARWSLRGAVLHKAAWLIFVEPESPLADLYARNLDKLTAAFGSRVEFRIVLVRMGAGEVLTVEEAGLWADVRKLRGRQVLVDPFGKIKPASHEPPLPQHVLVGRDGVLHYQGSGKLGKAPIAEQLKALEGGGR